MIPNPHSRRFDPRRLSRPQWTDWEELIEAVDTDLGSADGESTNDPDLQDFDEALEQIVSEECRACPLCGANVYGDKIVVIREPTGPKLASLIERTMRMLSRWNL